MKAGLLMVLPVLPVLAIGQNQIQNGGLESAGDGWYSTSTNFGSVVCSYMTCGDCAGNCWPRNGQYYAWFGGGGVELPEKGLLSQDFYMPFDGALHLSFYLKMAGTGSPSDSIMVDIDNNILWFKLGSDTNGFHQDYGLIELEIQNVEVGSHTLNFRGFESGQSETVFNALIDDINLVAIQGSSSVELLHDQWECWMDETQNLLHIKSTMNSELTLIMSDLWGRIIFKDRIQVHLKETAIIRIPMSDAGIYLLNLIFDGQSRIIKIRNR